MARTRKNSPPPEKLWQKNKVQKRTPRGLRNEDATKCYRNVILQTLLNAPDFSNWIRAHDQKSCRPLKRCVACSLRKFVGAYWADHDAARAAMLVHFWRTCIRSFWNKEKLHIPAEDGQCDSDEYLTGMLNAFKNQLPKQAPTLNRLFWIDFHGTFTCTNAECKKSSDRPDTTALSLQVNINPQKDVSIDQLVKQAFGEQKISKWRCPACKGEQGTMRERITNAPEILFIFINRFSGKDPSKKLKRSTPYSQTLDLSDCQDESKKAKDQGNTPLRYELFGVVSHRGERGHGHYINAIKGPTEEWFRISDRDVRETTFEAFEKSQKQNIATRFTPYLLAYVRTGQRIKVPEPDIPKPDRPTPDRPTPDWADSTDFEGHMRFGPTKISGYTFPRDPREGAAKLRFSLAQATEGTGKVARDGRPVQPIRRDAQVELALELNGVHYKGILKGTLIARAFRYFRS